MKKTLEICLVSGLNPKRIAAKYAHVPKRGTWSQIIRAGFVSEVAKDQCCNPWMTNYLYSVKEI